MTTTRVVEFAFTKSGGAYVYQDISAYVRSVSFSRGKSRQFDTYSPGSCSVTVDNRTRAFDPQASGTFSSEVKPAGSLRVKANGYVIWEGKIQDWSFDYEVAADSTATVTAIENTWLVSNAELPGSFFGGGTTGQMVEKVLNHPAVNYQGSALIMPGAITCQSTTASTGQNALDFINQLAATEWGDFYADRTGQLVFFDSTEASSFNKVTSTRVNYAINPSAETNATNWSLGSRSNATTAYVGSWCILGSALELAANYAETDASKYYRNQSFTVSIYVKNVTGTGSVTLSARMTNGGVNAGSAALATVTANASTWTRVNVTVSSLEECDGIAVVVSSLVSNVYVDGLLIEPGTSLNSYFDGSNGAGTSGSTVTTVQWDGTTNNSSSSLYVSDPASITYGTTTLADDGSGYGYTNISVVYGSEFMTNQATTVRVNGGTAIAKDQTSIDAYGVFAWSNTDNLASTDAQAEQVNGWRVANYKDPEYRVQSVTVNLEDKTLAQQNELVQRDIHDKVVVKFTPNGMGSQISKTYWIIGVSHDMTVDVHTVTWNLQLIDTAVFTLDSDFTGFLDSNVLG